MSPNRNKASVAEGYGTEPIPLRAWLDPAPIINPGPFDDPEREWSVRRRTVGIPRDDRIGARVTHRELFKDERRIRLPQQYTVAVPAKRNGRLAQDEGWQMQLIPSDRGFISLQG